MGAQNNSDAKIDDVMNRFMPAGLATTEALEACLAPMLLDLPGRAEELLDAVKAALDAERNRIIEDEGGARPVWDYFRGGEQVAKSVASIRSKLGRDILKAVIRGGLPTRPLTEDEVVERVLSFPDLGRFRVICDFSADADRAVRVLLGEEHRVLLERFPLRGVFKDYVFDLSKRDPAKGHRARQFSVMVRGRRHQYGVEIQVMTLLQHAWDRRNHPVYEWSREGGELPDDFVLRDVATAETLFLVDEQASRNWASFVETRRRGR